MRIEALVAVIGVALAVVFDLNNEHMLFVKVTNFTNLQYENLTLLESWPGCLDDCALQCQSSLKCLSFQHRPSTNECVLLSTLSFGNSTTNADDGWDYFRDSGGRCREEFSNVRILNICISYVGNYDVFDGRKQCSNRNASIITVRSEEEQELLKRLMVSFPYENQGKKPYIQGQWNGSHWLSDDGKPLEYLASQADYLDMKNFRSGDCLKSLSQVGQIAVSKCSVVRPIVCAYDII